MLAHETEESPLKPSICPTAHVLGEAEGFVEVTALPLLSTAMQKDELGHETESSPVVPSMGVGAVHVVPV
jgi:hypothetical protein